MSAGMSCKITIKFTPQINQNIIDKFCILAETGRVEIPLVCTYKKSVVVTDFLTIDFGKVIYGEDTTKKIILKNEGALPTNIKIKNARGETLKDKTETMSAYSRAQSATQKSKKTMGSGNQEEDDNMNQSDNKEEDEENNMDLNVLDQLKFNKTNRIGGYTTLEIPIKYVPADIKHISDFIYFIIKFISSYKK